MFKKQTILLFTLFCLISSNNLTANEENFNLDSIQNIELSDESDNDIIELSRSLSNYPDNPLATRELAGQILELTDQGYSISEYNYLWVLYSLLRNAMPEVEGGMLEQDYLLIADVALDYLDSNGVGDWVFTEQGQFKMEVYRIAGNGVGWTLRESDPEKALTYIEPALSYAREEDTYMQDTYVRVLLNLDQQDEAYSIVKKMLEQDQDFYDFQDFLTDEEYLDWLGQNDTAPNGNQQACDADSLWAKYANVIEKQIQPSQAEKFTGAERSEIKRLAIQVVEESANDIDEACTLLGELEAKVNSK